jgi:hypothetical protein
MKVIHKISVGGSAKVKRELASLGVSARDVGNAVVGELLQFRVSEADPEWGEIRQRLDKWQAVDVPETSFSAGEMKSAESLAMVADWHHGYPQPEDDFAYREATYDTSGYCPSCGIGLVQKAPFRMQGEPKWGKRSILQLNWVFDEYFCTPEAWETTLCDCGFGQREVLDATSGVPLKTVIQLTVDKVADASLDINAPTCGCNGHDKYEPVTRGFFPRPRGNESVRVFKTREWFGSGASAHKAVIVSQGVRRRIVESKLKGVSFVPLASASTP